MQKERSTGDIYEFLGEFMAFTKHQFDLQYRMIEKLSLDVKDLWNGQGVIEKDLHSLTEDMSGIAGAIAELVGRDEELEKRVVVLEEKIV